MGKETECVKNCMLYMVCVCLLKVIFLGDELSLLSMTVDAKFRHLLIRYLPNITCLATGKKHSDLERVTAVTSEQLSKNPLCKTKQCQDYSGIIGPEFKLFQ